MLVLHGGGESTHAIIVWNHSALEWKVGQNKSPQEKMSAYPECMSKCTLVFAVHFHAALFKSGLDSAWIWKCTAITNFPYTLLTSLHFILQFHDSALFWELLFHTKFGSRAVCGRSVGELYGVWNYTQTEREWGTIRKWCQLHFLRIFLPLPPVHRIHANLPSFGQNSAKPP